MTELTKVIKYTPEQVATDLMGTIKVIEDAIGESDKAIKKIEGRGFFENIISSDRDDLVAVSKSQNAINNFMLSLIQEIITLNVMSYSYLAAVLSEFHKKIKEGWIDSDGRFQELSETGEAFANTASDIFEKIIEGSRSTQQKIELNSSRIEGLQLFLEKKEALDEQQSLDIADLKRALRDKSAIVEQQSQQIKNLSDNLERKKSLIDEQSNQMEEIRGLLEQQTAVDEELTLRLAGLAEGLQHKEAQVVSRDSAINSLNRDVFDLKNRYQRLLKISGGLGLVVLLLTISVALVIFGIL